MKIHYRTRLNLFFIFILSAFNTSVRAQTECSEAATMLYNVLLKTASGKIQLKGKAARDFKTLADSVIASADKSTSQLGCFMQLSQLMQPLRDNHLHFSEKPVQAIPVDSLQSKTWIQHYRSTDHFKEFPRINLSLDSLEKQMTLERVHPWEGIYFLGNYMKLAVYKNELSDTLTAVVLESYLPQWVPGQVMAWFWPRIETGMASVYADYYNKNWNFHRNVRLINNRIPFLGWRKNFEQTDFVNISRKADLFSFKRLQQDIDYLRVGSFSAYTENRAASQLFLQKIKDSLSGKVLVIDLRNNGGGAGKVAKPFEKMLRKQARKKNVFLLMNNATVSEAECFIIKFMGRKNIYTVGETTRGMIAFGNNRGSWVETGHYFKLYITDMKGTKMEQQLEDYGVEPSIKLNPDSDWEEQLLKVIHEKSK